MTNDEFDTRFAELLQQAPLPLDALWRMITENAAATDEAAFEKRIGQVQDALVNAGDLDGLIAFFQRLAADLKLGAGSFSCKPVLKKTTKDKAVTAAIESAGFDELEPLEAIRRFSFIRTLQPGMLVMDKTWGIGTIRTVDTFFKRFTVDFQTRKNHAVPMAQAPLSLSSVNPGHLLARKLTDPASIAAQVKEAPAGIVREALRDFGSMSAVKLEQVLTENGILPATKWKSFWDNARKALKADPCVDLPPKRTDPIILREQPADLAASWTAAFRAERNIEKLLSRIDEAEAQEAGFLQKPEVRDALADRMAFAEKGTHNADPVLYARIALTCRRLGLDTPPPGTFRAHLWEKGRYIQAVAKLNAHETADLTAFLFTEPGAAERFMPVLGTLPYGLLDEVLKHLHSAPEAPACAARCTGLLLAPKAPPSLILWALRSRKDFADWKLPSLHDLMTHGLAILDEKHTKEGLRVQNTIKRLFENHRWFDAAFKELDPLQRQSVFERIQASGAWRNEPSTHHHFISRMIKAEPHLANLRKATTQEKEKAAPRLTSWRSLREKQHAYHQLVDVELPKNSQDIAQARSYGDLRENFEYQAAKDHQRQLLHRQSVMEKELRLVQGTDFAGITAERVAPGTQVTLTDDAGAISSYVILGEWDRDEVLHIISCRSRLAQCLLDHAVGERLLIPAEGGEKLVTLTAIAPLSDEVREWMGGDAVNS